LRFCLACTIFNMAPTKAQVAYFNILSFLQKIL